MRSVNFLLSNIILDTALHSPKLSRLDRAGPSSKTGTLQCSIINGLLYLSNVVQGVYTWIIAQQKKFYVSNK